MLYSSMKLRSKKMVLKKDIKDGVLKFMEHLNNTMDKPDGYEYELNTRGSKYFKVEMLSHGSRSVYCFIEKSTGIILKSAGWPITILLIFNEHFLKCLYLSCKY